MRRLLVVCCALALRALPLEAQFPAELAGRVLERGGAPIENALVEIDGGGRASTDASGAFLVRSAADGSVRVVVTRIGYTPLTTMVRLENGRRATVVLELDVAPVELDALEVRAEPADARGLVLAHDAIERSGARTLAELLHVVPGVQVRDDGAVSIRGGSADDVLVLVDGVPVNDPVTGAADLSLVPLHGVESVEVLPGARSARLGARAQSGAILVRTRAARATGIRAQARAGSLGSLGASGEAGLDLGRASLAAGARFHELDGDFRFTRSDALGGGRVMRENAGEREAGGFAAFGLGQLRVRADYLDAERGLPGPARAPTPEARQDLARGGVTASWMAHAGALGMRVDAHGAWQRLRFSDPQPAVGPAYFDTTDARDLGVRAELEHAAGARVIGFGAEARGVRLESSTLAPRTVERTEPALFARAATDVLRTRLSAALRADRWADDWIVSHDFAVRASAGTFDIELAHRSAFSPPAAGDQFFGSGIAIEPNPDLQPERVRSEIELVVGTSRTISRIPVSAGASAFVGDVDGMIVWAPDFRFVWSPRNRDVKRSGSEAWLRARPLARLDASAWLNVARVTYDWPGDADTVQVVYRPRYSGGASIDWTPRSWRLGLQAFYTGERFATPGPSNTLPGYWDVRLALGREWQRGPAQVAVTARVDRLLDNTDSFIHGYPEAGRRLSLELSVQPRGDSTTNHQSVQR